MTGIITSLPPLVEQPPGNNASNPAGLPGVTYTAAIPNLPQTWTGLQTFTTGSVQFAGSTSGNTFLNATAIASGTVILPAITGSDTLLANNNTATVTNKSIDGLQNTITNVPTGSLDPDLQAIAALTGTGLAARTAADTWAVRTITAGASIGITNGDGVAGNPTIAVTDAELVALAGLTSAADQLPYFTGSGTAALASFPTFGRSIAAAASQAAARTVLALTPGTDVQAFDSDLAALAANASTGLWAVTGAGTGSVRTLTAPAAGITVSNGGGVAGNPTLVLADDLAGVEGLATTGIVRRTGTSTWSAGTAVALSEMATEAAFTFVGNNTSGSAAPTAVDIAALTAKASPASTDLVMISDQAASGAWKKVTISSLASAGSVSSIAGNTGAFTLSNGITNSTNDIRLNIGHLPGEPSTGNAAAGEIGEVISSVIPSGSAVGISNGVTANVTSISLTAGDWDVSGVAYTTNPGTTVITFMEIAVSPTTATLPTRAVASGGVSAGSNLFQNFGGSSGSNESILTAPVRISLASTTTIFLVLNSTFTTSTLSAYGVLRARRMR